jgi:large subunit ribosomal protein L22
MKTSATAKFVGTSARKTGLVAQLIRGRRAVEAQVILANASQRAKTPVGKVLASAIANAENNFNAKARDLVVESVFIGPGPSLKRSMPRAKGSASAILKRSSHITVVLNDGKSAATLVTDKAEAAIAAEAPVVSGEAVADKTPAATAEAPKTQAKKPATKPAKKEAK